MTIAVDRDDQGVYITRACFRDGYEGEMNNALFVFFSGYLSAVLPFAKIIGDTSKMYTGI